jgi:hypothetical protein
VFSCRATGQVLDVVCASGVSELREHATKLCFETSLLGRDELGRNGKIGEFEQRFVDAFESLFELCSNWGGSSSLDGVGPYQAERCSQQVATVGSVGDAVGVNERERLASFEAVALDGEQDLVLVLAG